jgi:hypothetical protein
MLIIVYWVKHTSNKNTGALLITRKEIGLEVNTEEKAVAIY